MKVLNVKNIGLFFNTIDSCEGKVELVTGEGDTLNLKSKLSQYVALAEAFSNGNIPEMELMVSNPKDTEKLIKYMLDEN